MTGRGALLTERNDSYLAPLSLTDQCLRHYGMLFLFQYKGVRRFWWFLLPNAAKLRACRLKTESTSNSIDCLLLRTAKTLINDCLEAMVDLHRWKRRGSSQWKSTPKLLATGPAPCSVLLNADLPCGNGPVLISTCSSNDGIPSRFGNVPNKGFQHAHLILGRIISASVYSDASNTLGN